MPMTTLPPGFRFHPTDVELVCYYLKRKIMGKPIHFEAISEIELYKFAPWDLPGKSCLRGRDLEWYFFCVGEKKYSNGLRKNRATEVGYWKTTGKDKPISYNSRTIAMKKTLVFHEAKVQDGRTDWVMHEYRLEDVALAGAGFLQDAYVLCKIFKKSGRGPKIGEQYGAPFDETEWDDTKADDCSLLLPSLQGGTIMSTLHQPDPLPLDLDSCAVDSSPLSSTLDQWVHPNEVNEISTVENAQVVNPQTALGGLPAVTAAIEELPSQLQLHPVDGIHLPNSTPAHEHASSFFSDCIFENFHPWSAEWVDDDFLEIVDLGPRELGQLPEVDSTGFFPSCMEDPTGRAAEWDSGGLND